MSLQRIGDYPPLSLAEAITYTVKIEVLEGPNQKVMRKLAPTSFPGFFVRTLALRTTITEGTVNL